MRAVIDCPGGYRIVFLRSLVWSVLVLFFSQYVRNQPVPLNVWLVCVFFVVLNLYLFQNRRAERQPHSPKWPIKGGMSSLSYRFVLYNLDHPGREPIRMRSFVVDWFDNVIKNYLSRFWSPVAFLQRTKTTRASFLINSISHGLSMRERCS